MSDRRRITARREAFDLDVELRLEPSTVVAVMGPNGAGKTTLLHTLAGLDPDGSARTPGQVGLLFQDLRLFPHLTARDNVAFAHEAQGASRREARTRAEADLDRLGVGHLADRHPNELSGGEAQRIALARSLVGDPLLLLLDEPFANLDASARQELRRDLPELLRSGGRCTVVVTHDPVDAMVLADEVVVVEEGRVTHEGTSADIARHPRTPWAAELVGVNLVRGTGTADGVRTGTGAVIVCGDPVPEGMDMLARFDPAAVALHTVRPEASSARNIWSGEVIGAEGIGTRVRVEVDGLVPLVAELTPSSVERLGLAPGVRVWAEIKATEVTAYAAPRR